jgi:hypothetical protein
VHDAANSVAMGLGTRAQECCVAAAKLKADPAPTLAAVSKLMPVETLLLAYKTRTSATLPKLRAGKMRVSTAHPPTHPPTHPHMWVRDKWPEQWGRRSQVLLKAEQDVFALPAAAASVCTNCAGSDPAPPRSSSR